MIRIRCRTLLVSLTALTLCACGGSSDDALTRGPTPVFGATPLGDVPQGPNGLGAPAAGPNGLGAGAELPDRPEQQPEPEPEPEQQPEPAPEPEQQPEPEPEPEQQPEPAPEPEQQPEPAPEPEQQPEPAPEPEPEPLAHDPSLSTKEACKRACARLIDCDFLEGRDRKDCEDDCEDAVDAQAEGARITPDCEQVACADAQACYGVMIDPGAPQPEE